MPLISDRVVRRRVSPIAAHARATDRADRKTGAVADLMHDAGADHLLAGQRMRDGLQKRIAQINRQAAGGNQDRGEFPRR